MNAASRFFLRLIATVLTCSHFSPAAINETHLSLQGYSGVINTPNAMILPDGRMTFLFSNQTPAGFRNRSPDVYFNNYLLTIGFFPCVEITGRFTNASSFPPGPRDLSADIKCGYSFGVFNPWLPSIACGIQDVSGGAALLQTRYIVVSEEIKKLRISLGYGAGLDRMEGVFFGAELFLTPFLQLLFDNDHDQAAVAVRLATPSGFAQLPFSTAFMIKNVYREKTPLFTFSAAVSCDLKERNNREIFVLPEKRGTAGADTAGISGKAPIAFRPADLADRLATYGLENVSVDTAERKVRIRYENNRFGHNEMDALGIVLGAACTMADSSCDTIRATVLRSQVPVLIVKAERNDYRRFLATGDMPSAIKVENAPFTFRRESLYNRINPTPGRIRFEVSPRLRYFLGTEVGAFDYQLSANIDAFVPLWPGASCAARTVIPVWNTANFDEREAFSSYREKTHLNSASLYQFVNFGHGVTTLLSAGLHDKKYFALIDDVRFTDKNGFFRVGIEGGYFTFGGYYRTTILPYAGFQLPMDLFVKITGGVFWEQDTGIDISVTRRFNDIDLKFFCKYTKNIFDDFDMFVGSQIRLPLTFRKGMKPWFVSASGKDDWRTSLSTRVAEKGSLNYISTACGVIPDRLASMDSDFFNRDRLNRDYILKNERLLYDSWIRNR